VNKSRNKWVYIAIPRELAQIIDKIVEENKYPMGKYRSRNHFVLETLKQTLEKYERKNNH